MKALSVISIIVSSAMLVLMALFYLPFLDAPDTSMENRILFVSTFFLQSYLLIFSVYVLLKTQYPGWEQRVQSFLNNKMRKKLIN
jgi:hypothetical protein